MKLSNALKLSRSPNPCFVIVANNFEKNGITSWQAIHFWKEEIERTLKRARSASKAGRSELEFNRVWISFPLRNLDRQSDISLLPWIETTVRSLGLDYANAKREVLEKAGRPVVVAELHLAPDATTRQLVDYQLGLTEENPVSLVRIARWRFGVDIDLPEEEAAPLLTQLQQAETMKCVVQLVGPDGERITLQGETIRPNVTNLEEGEFKAVVRTSLIELTITDDGATANDLFSLTERRTPEEFEQISRFLRWGGAGQVRMSITDGVGRVYDASLEIGRSENQEAYSTLLPFFSHLRRIAEGISSKPTISMEEISKGLFTREFLSFLEATRFRIETSVPSLKSPPNCDSVVAFGATGIGDWIFAAIVRWEIEKDGLGERWAFNAVRPQTIERFCYPLLEDPELIEVKRLYERYSAEPNVTGLGHLKEIAGFGNHPSPSILRIVQD